MSSHLCQELMDEIFERLPSKSLIRFRSLSKSWYSRISSPDFIRMHILRSVNNSSHRVLIREMEIHRIDTYGLHSEDRFSVSQGTKFTDIATIEFPCIFSEIVGSCNGVLCLVDKTNSIILWNPSIRCKISIIDHLSFRYVFWKVRAVGFGFDPVSDDYKIVRISYLESNNNNNKGTVMVYSMKTRSWYPIPSPPTRFKKIKSGACIVNGALHWVAKGYSGEDDRYIMTFNLSTDTFGEIRLPKPSWKTKQPTIINGCLAVMSYKSYYDCWIWVMKEYNNASSWNVLFKLKTEHSIEGIMKGVLQFPTSGDFLINTYLGGLAVYSDPATRVPSVRLKHSFFNYHMEMCLESLELLDKC